MADQILTDGQLSFIGGQDASKVPSRIPETCYAAGVNVSTKQGVLRPRWGWERKTLSVVTDGIYDRYKRFRTYREVFEAGKYQAVVPYFIGKRGYLILVIAGFIYLVNPDTWEVSVIDIEDGSHLNSRARRINWSAAGEYLVLYDFPAYPVLINGLTARRADPDEMEVPVATLGAFNENRLFIANNGDEFTAGDPVGSTATPNAPISFEEIMTVGSPYYGQIFRNPTSDHNDPINYMGFLQRTDGSTEIGPLITGTDRAIYSFRSQDVRSNWDQEQFGSVLCYNAGIVGPRAAVNVGGDLHFLSADGLVRSLSMSRQEQSKWSRVPMSREVENWFVYNDPALKSLSFVSYFKNKIFFSVNPHRVTVTDFNTTLPISDYTNGGMVVLELDNFTSFGDASKPTWAGLWTGVRPMDMVTLGDRAFIISKDSSNINRIYEVNPEISYDTADTKVRFIKSKVRTREMDWKDPFQNKELHSIDANWDKLQGNFSFEAKYKPSHGPYFLPWRKFETKIPWRSCFMPTDCRINGLAPQSIRDFTLGAPEDMGECNPMTEDPYRIFRRASFEFTIEGKYWELLECRIKTSARPTSLVDNPRLCDPLPEVSVCNQCFDDWSNKEFESCQQVQT